MAPAIRPDKASYRVQEAALRTALLAAQFRARDAGRALLILVSGAEGAGKGQVVDQLSEWLDTRILTVRAFWDDTDEERLRPPWWRFWRALPARGEGAILFGSWYTRPILDHALGQLDTDGFHRHLERICANERQLVLDGLVLVKLWFHLDPDSQDARLQEDASAGRRSPLLQALAPHRAALTDVSHQALQATHHPDAPWHCVDASDDRHRNLAAGNALLAQLERALDTPPAGCPATECDEQPAGGANALDGIDLSGTVSRSDYRRRLATLQGQLYELAWALRSQRRHLVAVFEGWDAAGKGGAIRRITRAMDARLYRTITTGAPSDEERAHHYLWRFWRHIPMPGNMTIYDRSWYGRVLVERVEGFAEPCAWQRAYREINEFEAELVEHGTLVLKFWLHISPDEQLRRFREREQTPWKRHKITADDWRNRERWDDYAAAVNDMVRETSTPQAPWTLVPANDKRLARLRVLETFCCALQTELNTTAP